MKISCCHCGCSGDFTDDISMEEIEKSGFIVWGTNDDNQLEATCWQCVEKGNPIATKIPKKREKTIVISDLHLGDPSTHRENILHILNTNYNKIIITGNIFSSCHYRSMSNWDYVINETLQELQESGKAIILRGCEEEWIRDIHKYTKLKFEDHYEWDYLGQKFYACNGNHLGTAATLPRLATEFAAKNKYSAIFVGYTGVSALHTSTDGILYVNTGNFRGTHYNWAVMNGKDDNIRLFNSLHHNEKSTYEAYKQHKEHIKAPPIRVVIPDPFEIPRVNNKQLLEF